MWPFDIRLAVHLVRTELEQAIPPLVDLEDMELVEHKLAIVGPYFAGKLEPLAVA